jgi:hypothetical protein
MEVEVRIYDVMPDHVDDWVAAWTSGIAPLRRECGFDIVGAWLDRPESRFVWILSYEGEESFDVAERRYHAHPARERLQPEPSDWILATLIRRMVPIE